VHIATPNKKGFSGSPDLYQEILSSATDSGSKVYHEATVGAGLPVLTTLRDLLDTGDTILRIEGIFSGTLSYIFNTYSNSPSRTFSSVVGEAKENGYTEPDPRDDLNGMDVARKLTILARKVGLPVTPPPEAFPVQTLIPETLAHVPSGEAFLAGLPSHDDSFDSLRREALSRNSLLRYVGSIDVISKDISVGLQSYLPLPPKTFAKIDFRYPSTHPFAGLQGSDNIIAFYTERYGERPVIVQGAGYILWVRVG
jgi:homoserine dehydrogenase